MKWNKLFRKKDKFALSFLKEDREPKLFQFFPEAKNQIIKYCSDGVKNGSLSSEAARSEITNVILPDCYRQLLIDAGDDALLMPSLEELKFQLDITSICISTVWRWISNLNFNSSNEGINNASSPASISNCL